MNKNNKQKGFSGIAVIGIVAAIVVVVIMFGYSVTPKKSQTEGAPAAAPAPAEVNKAVDDSIKMEDGVLDAGAETGAGAGAAAEAKTPGSYQIYDSAKLALADSGADVVLFFNAKWCPICRGVESELQSSKIPDGLIILSVDYDTYNDLKKKYGVTYQHTFVQVDARGNLIAKWSGGGLSTIVSKVK